MPMDDIMNCGTAFLSATLEFAKYLERAEQKNLKLSAKKLQMCVCNTHYVYIM